MKKRNLQDSCMSAVTYWNSNLVWSGQAFVVLCYVVGKQKSKQLL